MTQRKQEDSVVQDALRITKTLNKHLSEDPECRHTLKEIAKEAVEERGTTRMYEIKNRREDLQGCSY